MSKLSRESNALKEYTTGHPDPALLGRGQFGIVDPNKKRDRKQPARYHSGSQSTPVMRKSRTDKDLWSADQRPKDQGKTESEESESGNANKQTVSVVELSSDEKSVPGNTTLPPKKRHKTCGGCEGGSPPRPAPAAPVPVAPAAAAPAAAAPVPAAPVPATPAAEPPAAPPTHRPVTDAELAIREHMFQEGGLGREMVDVNAVSELEAPPAPPAPVAPAPVAPAPEPPGAPLAATPLAAYTAAAPAAPAQPLKPKRKRWHPQEEKLLATVLRDERFRRTLDNGTYKPKWTEVTKEYNERAKAMGLPERTKHMLFCHDSNRQQPAHWTPNEDALLAKVLESPSRKTQKQITEQYNTLAVREGFGKRSRDAVGARIKKHPHARGAGARAAEGEATHAYEHLQWPPIEDID